MAIDIKGKMDRITLKIQIIKSKATANSQKAPGTRQNKDFYRSIHEYVRTKIRSDNAVDGLFQGLA